MQLHRLLDPGVTVIAAGGQAAEVTALTADSRAVAPGALFAALPGARADGRQFVGEAIANGAVAVLGDRSLADAGLSVPLIVDADPRRRLALIAARFYQNQPATVVAVTGTNGKTSVATFTRQMWARLGHRAAALGTLGLDTGTGPAVPTLTTPDPVELHRLLAEIAADGIDHLALEASSHGLDQRRLDGVRLTAAAFTNLSRDHLDYHATDEDYFAAKERLFSELLPPRGTAVLNADGPQYERLAARCRARGVRVLDYGRQARRLRLVALEVEEDGQRFDLAVHGGVLHTVRTRLVGDFQVANLLGALGLVIAAGADAETAIATMGAVDGARGRLERVGHHPAGAPIYVDYAHTPDALDHALAALRPHCRGALWVVFGAGGDRDPGKRVLMGQAAAGRADRVIVTDDNPRTEDPAAIRAAVLRGCPEAREVGDRAEAIRTALAGLAPGDLLLIAGKGHERGQTIGDRTLPFDDATEARTALAELGGAAA